MPDSTLIFRAFLIGILIALMEVLFGILRQRLLNRRVGDHKARQIGVGISCLFIFLIACLVLPWTGAAKFSDLIFLGLIWLALMLAFDLAVGRILFHFPWKRIRADFDPRRGNLLGIGMLFLFIAPSLAGLFRGIL